MSPVSLTGRPLSALEAWAAVGVLSALVFWSARLLKRPGARRAKALLSGARLAAVLLGVLILWAPDLVVRRRRADVPVALVLDDSASMAAADAGAGKTARAKAAAEAIKGASGLFRPGSGASFFRLGAKLARGDWDAPPVSPASNFLLLSDLPAAVPGLKAVFFFSDGRRGGGGDPLPRLAAAGVPVYTVGVGNPAATAGLVVEDLAVPPFAFKDTEVQAAVRLRPRGLPPGRATLRVVSRGRTLGSREISWTREEVLEATVSFRPARVGLESFELRAAPAGGEASAAGARRFVLDVVRNRRRILYICGRPGPDYAFLRHQLKTDPTVELVTFVILRDMEDLLSVPDRELSLIPFPAQAQLLDGLSAFDAVIFEDFSFSRFGIGAQGMIALRRFVEAGGGFLLLGEGDSFGPDGNPYRGSALEPLLPFRLDAPLIPGPASFRALPLPGGRALTGSDEADDPWARLPALDGPGLFPGALRPGAVPVFSAAGGSGPVWAALFPAGRGRTMAVASLDTWRWALGEAGQGRGTATYARFWTRTLNWLTGGEDFRKVRLEVPPAGVDAGDGAVLRAYVRDESGTPVSDAEVRLEARAADGPVRSEKMDAAGEGTYVWALPPGEAGNLVLKARAFRGGRPLGEAEAVLKVGAGWEEARDVTPDFAALEEFSRVTGGRFTPLAGFDARWASRALDDASWDVERRTPLGTSPWTAVVLLGILLAEWTGRRGKGFP